MTIYYGANELVEYSGKPWKVAQIWAGLVDVALLKIDLDKAAGKAMTGNQETFIDYIEAGKYSKLPTGAGSLSEAQSSLTVLAHAAGVKPTAVWGVWVALGKLHANKKKGDRPSPSLLKLAGISPAEAQHAQSQPGSYSSTIPPVGGGGGLMAGAGLALALGAAYLAYQLSGGRK